MTYLLKVKDSELTAKRLDLLKRFAKLKIHFNTLWYDKEETFAPYNEMMVKDYSPETFNEFLTEFNTVVNEFMEEGIFTGSVSKFVDVFDDTREAKYWMDIGFVLSLSKFFSIIDKRLMNLLKKTEGIIKHLEKILEDTNSEFSLEDTGLGGMDIISLSRGMEALISDSGEDFLGGLPTINLKTVGTMPMEELKAVIKPIHTEYVTLTDYFKLLHSTIKDTYVENEEVFLTDELKIDALDNRMSYLLEKGIKTHKPKFSDLQRTLVAHFYLETKKKGVERQLDDSDKSIRRDLMIRFDVLAHYLSEELGLKGRPSIISSCIRRANFNDPSLTDLESNIADSYFSAVRTIAPKASENTYGVLEHKQLVILAILLELLETTGQIVYHTKAQGTTYMSLQYALSQLFVRLNPRNRVISRSLVAFPFKFGDGIIEGYLRKYVLNQPQEEPTVNTLIQIIANRNKLSVDLEETYKNLLFAMDKAVERNDTLDTLVSSLEDVSNNGVLDLAVLRTLS